MVLVVKVIELLWVLGRGFLHVHVYVISLKHMYGLTYWNIWGAVRKNYQSKYVRYNTCVDVVILCCTCARVSRTSRTVKSCTRNEIMYLHVEMLLHYSERTRAWLTWNTETIPTRPSFERYTQSSYWQTSGFDYHNNNTAIVIITYIRFSKEIHAFFITTRLNSATLYLGFTFCADTIEILLRNYVTLSCSRQLHCYVEVLD